jgi:prepilin-type N-terminal cleavage/methylation domain-containing protein
MEDGQAMLSAELFKTDANPPPRRRAGFTLLEVMISLALVVILVLGINEVFSLSSQTVGVGQTLSGIQRDNRAAQFVFYSDLRSAVLKDPPCFIIRSERLSAFRNRPDRDADHDNKALTIDLNKDGIEGNAPGEVIPPAIYNSRSHRLDRLGFFARDLFHRQTGNDATLVSNMSGSEAWIVYGHLKQPDNTDPNAGAYNSNFKLPGELDPIRNPNNYFATQWILGRTVMVLRNSIDGAIIDNPYSNQKQQFIKRSSSGDINLTPLSENSQAADGQRIQWSRYDLADTSIDQMRTLVGNFPNDVNSSSNFWDILLGFRYQGNTLPLKPLTSAGAAQTVPCFLPHCTQFIVEYAGDYITQDPVYGTSIPIQDTNPNAPFPYTQRGDGTIDFVVDNNVRKVRWYGMPRDINNDGVIDSSDVVPLRDLMPAGRATSFEKVVPVSRPNYAATGNAGMQDNERYVVAWDTSNSDNMPKMIRITFTLDDPNGRISEGQTFEYIIDLQ